MRSDPEIVQGSLTRRALCAFPLALACAAAAPAAVAETAYPSRPIRLVVPFAPGGGVDLIARLFAKKLGDRLGQPIVVDNRAGASSIIGTDYVAMAPADGYTLLMTSTTVAANQSLFRALPYNLARDFTPVGLVANAPAILVVNPSVPATDLKQFIALASGQPGVLSVASYGNGSAPHLVTELFEQLTRIRLLHVPYKGGGPAAMAVLSGEASALMPSVLPVLNQVREGKLRALGIASHQRHPLLPKVPTFQEQSVPLETGTWFGVLGPAKLPAPIAGRLGQEIAAILADKEFRERLIAEGAEPLSSTPAAFGTFLNTEVQRWRSVVAAAGIRPE